MKVHTDHAATERDLARIRADLHDRLTRLDHTGDAPLYRDRAIDWLAEHNPDLLNEALTEGGAPQ